MTHILKILAGVTCATAFIATASVAATPVYLLTPTFTEKTSDVVAPEAKGAPACSVTISGLNDLRRDQKTIGVIAFRAVQSPDDTQAWLRGIVAGLAARGVTPVFDTPAAGSASSPAATVGLKTVWISPMMASFASDVIVSVDAAAPDGRTLKKSYRGQIAVVNWNNGAGEIQSAISRAFSDALNKMAPDLKVLCQPKQG